MADTDSNTQITALADAELRQSAARNVKATEALRTKLKNSSKALDKIDLANLRQNQTTYDAVIKHLTQGDVQGAYTAAGNEHKAAVDAITKSFEKNFKNEFEQAKATFNRLSAAAVEHDKLKKPAKESTEFRDRETARRRGRGRHDRRERKESDSRRGSGEKAEVRSGEPAFRHGKIEFYGAYHSESSDANLELREAKDRLRNWLDKGTNKNNLSTHLKEEFHGAESEISSVISALHTHGIAALESPRKHNLDKRLSEKCLDYIAEHAPNSYSANKDALLWLADIEREKMAVQAAKLKSMDISKIEGYIAHRVDDMRKAISTFTEKAGVHPTFSLEAFEHNFSRQAWESSQGAVLAKGAGALAGLGLMGDAIFRDTALDSIGDKEKRSAIGRWTEFIIGGLTAGASLFHNRR